VPAPTPSRSNDEYGDPQQDDDAAMADTTTRPGCALRESPRNVRRGTGRHQGNGLIVLVSWTPSGALGMALWTTALERGNGQAVGRGAEEGHGGRPGPDGGPHVAEGTPVGTAPSRAGEWPWGAHRAGSVLHDRAGACRVVEAVARAGVVGVGVVGVGWRWRPPPCATGRRRRGRRGTTARG